MSCTSCTFGSCSNLGSVGATVNLGRSPLRCSAPMSCRSAASSLALNSCPALTVAWFLYSFCSCSALVSSIANDLVANAISRSSRNLKPCGNWSGASTSYSLTLPSTSPRTLIGLILSNMYCCSAVN